MNEKRSNFKTELREKKIIMIDLKRQPLSMVMPEEVQEPQTRCKEGDNAHHTSDAGDQAPEEDSCLCLEE